MGSTHKLDAKKSCTTKKHIEESDISRIIVQITVDSYVA